MFLWYGSFELNNHSIYLDWHLSSDHVHLTVTILIMEENINICKRTIIKDSVEEVFIKDVTAFIRSLDTSNLSDIPMLEKAVNDLANNIDSAWVKNSKFTNITKHSKSWWENNCSRDLKKYRSSKSLKDWKAFYRTVKNTKRFFFDLKILEITNKKQGLWELMS